MVLPFLAENHRLLRGEVITIGGQTWLGSVTSFFTVLVISFGMVGIPRAISMISKMIDGHEGNFEIDEALSQ